MTSVGFMAQIKRLVAITQLLRSRPVPCKDLAEVFGVDTRTIKRDIRLLKEEFECPVETGRGGYVINPSRWKFDLDVIFKDPDLEKKILEEFKSGVLRKRIAEKYGLPLSKVLNLCRGTTVAIRAPYNVWQGKRIEQLKQLYLVEDKTASEIADIFKTQVRTVHAALRRYGIRKSRRESWTPTRLKQIRKLYLDQGLSQKEVAAELGVTLTTLHGVLQHKKIQRRSNKKTQKSPKKT